MEEKQISFHDIFYIFLSGCFFGWLVEGIWTLLKKGILINHTALVLGPFNIVYGIGAITLTLALYKFQNKSYIKLFGISFAIGTILEYILSFLMEHLFGFVAWNYRKKPFNINGRVCLQYSVFWGILGIFWIKAIYPKLKNWIDKFSSLNSIKLMKIIIVFLIFDIFLTLGAIDRGKEYDQGIPPSNKIEVLYDKYFGVDYLNNMFNNRWNKK